MKIYAVSLGCAKNQVDAEVLLNYVEKYGHSIVSEEKDADAVIIMTCAFIKPARDEAEETISEFIAKKGRYGFKVIVGGCYSSRYSSEVCEKFPDVDGWFGISNFEKINEILELCGEDNNKNYISPPEQAYSPYAGCKLTTPSHWAWLKIADGCLHGCAYCAIPQIRGRYRSRKIEEIVSEAALLVANGVRELNVIAQDTGLYGIDLYGKSMLCDLLRELAAISELKWIRLLYINPQSVTDELIDLMATESKIVKYLDIPFQHASRAVLKRMNRPGDYDVYITLVNKIKAKIQGISIRSSFIAGFPGESDEDFQTLKRFLQEARITRAGFFTYSQEEGTAAYLMDGQISTRVKNERYNELIKLQQRISLEISKERKGQIIQAMIGSCREPGQTLSLVSLFKNKKLAQDIKYICRSEWDAPAVDGFIFAAPSTGDNFMPGDVVSVKIDATALFDAAGYITTKGMQAD